MLHRANVRAGERIVRKIDDETHASSGCMLHNIGPRLDEIEAEVAAVSGLREKPAGTIRITATENATETILVPKLAPLLQKYPDIKVEIIIDYGLTNIVAQQYDAGVRSGEQVARGTPQDLIGHNCINLRLPVHGGVYVCDSSRGSRAKSALDLAG
ncbi:MAG: hypothetical protein E5X52_34495 [Mesorhizobium sp.]|nr:MAG: hypothetical protein E5X52_34495 [Mesorhizobium sp.]